MYDRTSYDTAGAKTQQNYSVAVYLVDIYRNFVDAIIPRTPELAYLYGLIQYYGALDSQTEEYLIMILDSYPIPLAIPVAEMLKYAANNLMTADMPLNQLEIVSQLRQLQIDPANLPQPFTNNPLMFLTILDTLKIHTMMGYYSEWSGYGTTRLNPPDQRILEYNPISWEQVDYPGPSLGYRALRMYEFG